MKLSFEMMMMGGMGNLMKQDSDYVKAFHLFLPFKYFEPAQMKTVLKVLYSTGLF